MATLTTRQRSAAGGSVVLVGGLAATAVLNYAFGVALAWVLPRDVFGAVTVLQNLLLLAAAVLAAAFPWALARAVARGDDPTDPGGQAGRNGVAARAFRTALAGNVALGVALAVGLVVAQRLTGRLLPGASWQQVAFAASTVLVLAVGSVLVGALQGWRRFDALSSARVLEVTAKVGLGLLAGGVLGLGTDGIAAALFCAAAVSAGWAWWSLRDRLPGRGPLDRVGTVAVALPIGAATTGFGVLITLDVLLLGALGAGTGLPLAAVATYQAAAIVARAPFYLGDAVSDAIFPYVARSRGPEEAHRWFTTGFRWLPLALLPVQLVLIVTPRTVVDLMFPAEYADAAGLVRLVSVGTVGLLAADMLLKALIARGIARPAAVAAGAAAAVEALALVVLVPRLGAAGAAAGFAAGTWTAAALLGRVYLRHHRPGRLRPRTVLGYAAAIGVLLPCLAAATAVARPVALLLIAAGLGGYVAVVVRTGLVPAADLARWRAAAPLARVAQKRVPEQHLPEPHLPKQRGPEQRVPARPAPARPPRRRRRWSWRWLAAPEPWVVLGATAVSGVAMFWNLRTSPDTQYDEVVYTEAAQRVAANWELTWTNEPFFVHPPLTFLLEGGWLRLLGLQHAQLADAIVAARYLAAGAAVLSILLLGLLAAHLMPYASRRRGLVLVVLVVVLASTDAVLLRYGRLALIEPYALAATLVTLCLAVWLRNHRAAVYIPVVGLATGLALLTKEITAFLVFTPVAYAVLSRARRQTVIAAVAFLWGLLLWTLFPLWAAQLGLTSSFVDVKFASFERLLGMLQITGWNRPGVSFVSAIGEQALQYGGSYLLLAGGAAALLWLLLHEVVHSTRWLQAWLLTSYAFAAYTVLFGTLNEQFFVYVLPAAIMGTVLLGDALLVRLAAGLRSRRGWVRRASAAGVAAGLALVLGVLGFAAAGWARFYVPDNDGVFQVADFVDDRLPPCAALSTTGDAVKYADLMPGREVGDFATAGGAASHGVELFVLSDKDVASGYGNATVELTDEVRSRGTLLATFDSATYRGLELWQLPLDPDDPLAGVESTPDGVFVVTEELRCGGFDVADTAAGDFASAYAALGGKATVGVPLTRSWTSDGRSYQVFTGAVLATSGPGDPAVAALPVVADLADAAAADDPAADDPTEDDPGLPPVRAGAVPDDVGVRARLTDPRIAEAYLGARVDTASEAGLAPARALLGPPLGPPATLPDGTVRQAFGGGVLEHPQAPGPVRLMPIGKRAVDAGLVTPPEVAELTVTPPPLPSDEDAETAQPTSSRPFAASLAVALTVYLGFPAALLVAARRRRRRAAPEAEVDPW